LEFDLLYKNPLCCGATFLAATALKGFAARATPITARCRLLCGVDTCAVRRG